MPKDKIVEAAWSDLYPGLIVRWTTPTFVQYGVIEAIRKSSMRVNFSGKSTVIPDAKWYFVRHKERNPENGLCVVRKNRAQKESAKKTLPDSDFIHTAEACELFGVDSKELRRWLRSGKVTGSTREGRWLVSAQSLGRHLSERR